MNIRLINPPPSTVPNYPNFGGPIGLAYIAAYLRGFGNKVTILDAACPNVKTTKKIMTIDDAIASAPAPDVSVYGISSLTDNFKQGIQIAAAIKQNNPDALIVFGGHHPTATYEYILAQYPMIDAVILGEGEEAFLEIVNRVKDSIPLKNIPGVATRQSDGSVAFGGYREPPQIDNLPFPARDLLPSIEEYSHLSPRRKGDQRQRPVASVVSSRGCVGSCSFCSIQTFYHKGGKKWRTRSVGNIIEEILFLKNSYGSELFIYFNDDSFLTYQDHIIKLCEQLIERDVNLPFFIQARSIDIVKAKDIFPLLVRAGLVKVEVGLESGCERVLDRFNKGSAIEDNRKAIAILKDFDLGIEAGFIMFDPETVLNDLRDNFVFLDDLNININPFTRIMLFPGTPIWQTMINAGKTRGNAYIECPDYDFDDPQVQRIYDYFQIFGDQIIPKATSLVNNINTLYGIYSMDHRYSQSMKLLFDLKQSIYQLPYRVLKILVDLESRGILQTSSFQQVTAKSEQSIDQATRLFNTIVTKYGWSDFEIQTKQ